MKKNSFAILWVAVALLGACTPNRQKAVPENTDPECVEAGADEATPEPVATDLPMLYAYHKAESFGPEIETEEEGKKRTSDRVDIKMSLEGIPAEARAGAEMTLSRVLMQNGGESLAQAVQAYGDSARNDHVDNIKSMLEYADPSHLPLWELFCEMEGKVREDHHPLVVAYTIHEEVYLGGPHGDRGTTCVNMDAATGRHITAAEAFAPERKEDLAEAIRAALCREYEVSTVEELKDSTGLLTQGDVFVSDRNFLLGSREVTFVYNAYAIGPYASGPSAARVPYSALKGICKYAPQ